MRILDFEKLSKEVPEKYHFLFKGKLIDTDAMEDKYRTEEFQKAAFNRCEKCGYDLFTPEAYSTTKRISFRHPVNGYVHYYNRHKLMLCDKCVDELNGQPWK